MKLPKAVEARKQLETTLKQFRDAECALVSGLQARLSLLVRRQALDLQCWDFIAAGRSRLREILSPNSTEWSRFQFEGESQRIPPLLDGRLKTLHALTRYLAKHRDHESVPCRFTVENGRRISKALRTVLEKSAEVRKQITAAARITRDGSIELSGGLQTLRSIFWSELVRRDRRWIATGCPLSPHPALTSRIPKGGSPSCGEVYSPRMARSLPADLCIRPRARSLSPGETTVIESQPASIPQSQIAQKLPQALGNLSLHTVLKLLFPEPGAN